MRITTPVQAHVIIGLAAGLLGWGVSQVFRPGLIGSDGMWQVHQAWAGTFNDWSPPAMSVALRWVLLTTGSLGTATLVQAVLGCAGLAQAARAGLRFAFPAALSARAEAAAAVGVVVVLLVPPSPLAYFLVYVQTDGWLLVALPWAVAGWLNLLAGGRAAWWAAAVLGSTAAVLVRHNAVVLVPLIAVLAWLAAAGRARLPAAVAVAVLPLVAGPLLTWPYPVERLHPVDQVLAVELVGVCVAREDLRAELPYTNAHLIEDRFRVKHVPGFVNTMYQYSPAEHRPTDVNFVGEVVDGTQRLGSRHAELVEDYRRALRVAPGTVAGVKWQAFWGHLTMDHPGEHWHPTGIVSNTLGLAPNRGFAGFRERLADVDRAADASPTGRRVVMNHLPWVIVNLVVVVVAGAAAWRGSRRAQAGLLVALLPLGYVASYALATAGPQYRYMYPSTLLVQAGALVAVVGGVSCLLRRRQATGPA